MTDQERKAAIGAKLSKFRRQAGLTQVQLAEKLNYSDKAISKWERGESVPDILTLQDIARVLGIPPESFLEEQPQAVPSPGKHFDRRRLLRLIYAGILALALLSFVILQAFSLPGSWLGLLYMFPVAALVGLILNLVWRNAGKAELYLTVLIWTVLLSICVSLRVFLGNGLWLTMLLGIPGQILTALSFHRRRD